MSEPSTAIERQEQRITQLERVLGTGDMEQTIALTRKNVNAAIQFAEEREFVTRYPIERNGKRVGERLWFHLPTWQLLGQAFGLTAYTEGMPDEVKPGTWRASAVCATIEDQRVVGRSVGMCTRTEAGKKNMSEHTLAAIAQARAQRNALRSTLGAVLVAAGFEISDPEGPATKDQKGQLHILERELGFDHDTIREELGINSFNDLTGQAASELIEAWKMMKARQSGEQTGPSRAPDAGVPEKAPVGPKTGEVPPSEPRSSGTPAPTLDELWKRAATVKLTATKAKAFAETLGIKVKSASDLDVEQMQKVLTAWMARKG